MSNPIYIVNKNLHYFAVEDPIDISKLKDCFVLESLESVYTNIMRLCGLDFDEVEGNEFTVKDGRMFASYELGYIPTEGDIESFISNFQL